MATISRTRSSLEEMLDSLRKRTENEKPKDLPPELPARPISNARRPRARYTLPKKLDMGDVSKEYSNNNSSSKKEEVVKVGRVGSFGAKKVKEVQAGESPYVKAPEEKGREQRLQRTTAKHGTKRTSSMPRFSDSDWNDNIGYFIKKVNITNELQLSFL